jgi:hypothetical protein
MATPGNHIFHGTSNTPDFASAAWENGDGESIPDFSLDSNVPGKYKTTVSNILSKHCSEVKNASEEVIQQVTSVSKKRLKELIAKHNNDIFSFMGRPDKTPNMIGLAETIFRRYGHDIPTLKGAGANTILRDLNLDASMCKVVQSFDESLKQGKGDGGIDDFVKQNRWIYNQYKTIGEDIIRLEGILFQKIDLLDKVNNRLPMITSLAATDALPDLINSFGKYAESVYKSSQIEEYYKELVEAYKKWNICRQIIVPQSYFKNESNIPQCAICLNDSISTAIVPCGHTFCGNCIKKQNTTCYICRGNIKERIKLYFT